MHIKTVILYLLIFGISDCSGSGSDKGEVEIVYQFARLDCSSGVESFVDNKQKLIDNDIKIYSSQCLLTQDIAMLPVCHSGSDPTPSSRSGLTFSVISNSLSEEELINLEISDMDYFISSSTSGDLFIQSSSSALGHSDEPGLAGAFSATLPEGVGVVRALIPSDSLIAYAHEIPTTDLSMAESLGFNAAKDLEGQVDFIDCE